MILPVLKKHLLLVNAVIWGLPGAMILLKGVKAYVALQPVAWWMYLVSLVVFVLFALMFSKIVRKYSDKIAGLEGDRVNFPIKSLSSISCSFSRATISDYILKIIPPRRYKLLLSRPKTFIK